MIRFPKNITLLITAIILLPITFFGQDDGVEEEYSFYYYEKDKLTSSFHESRREALREKLPENSVAVFFTAPVRNKSNDVDYEYHQDPDFYYLTGLNEPHGMLLIFKDEFFMDSIKTDELLFTRKRNPGKEIWEGKMLGVDGVKKVLGFKNAYSGEKFSTMEIQFGDLDKVFYQARGEDVPDDKNDKGDLFSLIRHFHKKTEKLNENLTYRKLPTWMAELREIKEEEELSLMKKAIDITGDAHIELMKTLKPGMTEYQSEAVVQYWFKKEGAEKPGFPSILGGGENSCVLHYTTNRKTLGENDMLVIDIGAEYHGYTADVTRTLPVNGVFSEEQKIIYEIVLKAQRAGIEACQEGNKFWDPHQVATKIISESLLELGIIDKGYKVRDYFMHGTSHYLGLDVHDAGTFEVLKPGNVITVEPGIYIQEGADCDPKWWNIGVRIEDDILVTEKGPVNLSDKAPRTVEEIEKLMKEKSPLNETLK